MLAKRILDLVIVLLSLPAWLPLLGFVALLVRLRLGRPVLFVQERPGLRGRLFKLVKFRTMQVGESQPDDQRLTQFGKQLRATSLDELPELWNVVRGEMSLVGPRPLLKKYLPLYSPEQNRRHDVPPGMTGWAQIHGRNLVAWQQRLALDVWYADHWSLWLDVKIILKTIGLVFSRKGIAAEGCATMPEFQGLQDH